MSTVQSREIFCLHLVERSDGLVETRAIGYAHASVPLPFDLDELAGLLADGAFAAVGQALYEALFPEGEMRDSLAEALVVTRAEREPLALQLHLDAGSPSLARYPWELVHDGQSFLVADGIVALARYVDSPQVHTPAQVHRPLRLLFVSPRPVNVPGPARRPAAGGLPPLLAALEPLRQQGLIQIDILSPPTYAALRQVLSNADYEIVHLDAPSGLASPAGQDYLIFEDENGGGCPVDGQTLYNALFLSKVRLAVLTPPFPEPVRPGYLAGITALAGLAPALIRAGVPAVVAMQYALADEQNERFAAQLYRSLAEGAPLGTAVAHARGQLLPPESTRFAPAVYLQDREGAGELFAGPVRAARAKPPAYVPFAPGRISGGYRPEPVFVDRAQAVQQTLTALAGPGERVCIWGLGGVGKTAVAHEVVRRGAWRFPGGAIWLGLQGGRSLPAILSEIAGFYRLAKLAPRLEEAAPQVTTCLAEEVERAGGEILLVLDNLEDAASDPELLEFIAGLPRGVRVLATSRSEPPGVWQAIELRAMSAGDIEEILRHKIRAQGIQVLATDEPLLAEISALLEGYPLGVDLVLSLARTCSWARIRDELRAQPPPPLEAILRTTISGALNDEERRVAARLSVLRGPFDGPAIARVTGTSKWLPLVQRLRELALLSFDGNEYGFDAPVREYLYGLLGPAEARECHEQAYHHFAKRRDLDGLVQAYQHAIEAGQYEAARRLLRDKLMDALINAGRYHQLLRLLDAALAVPAAFDERFLLGQATVQRLLGRLAEALESLERLLSVPDLSVPTRAMALHEQGRVFYEMDDEDCGDHQQALDLYAQALAICEDLAEAGVEDRAQRRWLDAELAGLFQDVATVYQYALARPEDLAFARRLYATSAAFWQRLRDSVSRAVSEKQRAEILRTGSAEDKAEAKRIYRQLMQTFKRKGLERYYGDALLQLGKIYQDEHNYKHALRRFQEYEEIQRRLGVEREEAMAWKQQGEINQEAGYRGRSVRRAVELYSRALGRLTQYSDRWSRRTVVATYLRRGEAYLELGLRREAAEDFHEAFMRSIEMGSHEGEFDVGRLSEADRRRFIWSACALAHTADEDDEEAEACGDFIGPVSDTCHLLEGQTSSPACADLDCSQLLDLPGWVKHHAIRKK